MKVRIDDELCTGCGLCEEICPQVFKLEDELAIIVKTEYDSDDEECITDAQDQCPVEAIIVE